MDAIRGRRADEAMAILKFVPNFAAAAISKVLKSAISNADNNHGMNTDNLKLVEARVDEGPRIKRVRARAQGRAYRILKRMCHISVVVEEVAPKIKPIRKKATPSTPSAAPKVKAVAQPSTAKPAEKKRQKAAPAVAIAPAAESVAPAPSAKPEAVPTEESTAAATPDQVEQPDGKPATAAEPGTGVESAAAEPEKTE